MDPGIKKQTISTLLLVFSAFYSVIPNFLRTFPGLKRAASMHPHIQHRKMSRIELKIQGSAAMNSWR
jgi:hypothetical protein